MPTPTTISISSGNNQAQGIAGNLLTPLEVLVLDGNGSPYSGQAVSFAVATYPTGATGQAVSATSANTGADGKASIVATIGNLAGAYTFTATATGLTGSPLTFTASGLAIVSLASTKAYLNFTDTTNDATLLEWIGYVTQTIEDRLGRQAVCPRPMINASQPRAPDRRRIGWRGWAQAGAASRLPAKSHAPIRPRSFF